MWLWLHRLLEGLRAVGLRTAVQVQITASLSSVCAVEAIEHHEATRLEGVVCVLCCVVMYLPRSVQSRKFTEHAATFRLAYLETQWGLRAEELITV